MGGRRGGVKVRMKEGNKGKGKGEERGEWEKGGNRKMEERKRKKWLGGK